MLSSGEKRRLRNSEVMKKSFSNHVVRRDNEKSFSDHVVRKKGENFSGEVKKTMRYAVMSRT